jgi:hypothetical protein
MRVQNLQLPVQKGKQSERTERGDFEDLLGDRGISQSQCDSYGSTELYTRGVSPQPQQFVLSFDGESTDCS